MDDVTAQVAGVVTGSPRIPEVLGAVIFPEGGGHGDASRRSAIIRTAPGAAQQVAAQAPYVIDPYAPEELEVEAPPDPTSLRVEIEGSVRLSLVVVTVVAILAAVLALGNAMALAVGARAPEIGLRRALGARPRHIYWLIQSESAIIGLFGGAAGVGLGLAAILAITITQGWIPVFDLRLAPAALAGGLLVGAFAGSLAGVRAIRVQPSEALRA